MWTGVVRQLPHPIPVMGMRRWPSSGSISTLWQRPSLTDRYFQLAARWKKNFSRLYARRLLEIAAASAATQRLKTQLAAATQHIDRPEEWLNWQAKDWEATALDSVGKSRATRFWMAATRLANLAVLSSPMLVLYPLSMISDRAKDAAWSYALWGIEQAGPTWIKLTQWATTRQDLFSPEFCKYFGKLRDETEGHAWKETERILEENFGPAYEALSLDPTPIGSGCIAQVYRGTLNEPTTRYPKGTKVAVKVQHPGIWYKVRVRRCCFSDGRENAEDWCSLYCAHAIGLCGLLSASKNGGLVRGYSLFEFGVFEYQ